MLFSNTNSKAPSERSHVEHRSPPERGGRRFRIQEAILILRQGKSHPLWREAAWHLVEHAAKDTQLLLEAQRDLLLASAPQESMWTKRALWGCVGALGFVLVGFSLWVIFQQVAQC